MQDGLSWGIILVAACSLHWLSKKAEEHEKSEIKRKRVEKRESVIKKNRNIILESIEFKSNLEVMGLLLNQFPIYAMNYVDGVIQIKFEDKKLVDKLINILNTRIMEIENQGYYNGRYITNLYDAVNYCRNEGNFESSFWAFSHTANFGKIADYGVFQLSNDEDVFRTSPKYINLVNYLRCLDNGSIKSH